MPSESKELTLASTSLGTRCCTVVPQNVQYRVLSKPKSAAAIAIDQTGAWRASSGITGSHKIDPQTTQASGFVGCIQATTAPATMPPMPIAASMAAQALTPPSHCLATTGPGAMIGADTTITDRPDSTVTEHRQRRGRDLCPTLPIGAKEFSVDS